MAPITHPRFHKVTTVVLNDITPFFAPPSPEPIEFQIPIDNAFRNQEPEEKDEEPACAPQIENATRNLVATPPNHQNKFKKEIQAFLSTGILRQGERVTIEDTLQLALISACNGNYELSHKSLINCIQRRYALFLPNNPQWNPQTSELELFIGAFELQFITIIVAQLARQAPNHCLQFIEFYRPHAYLIYKKNQNSHETLFANQTSERIRMLLQRLHDIRFSLNPSSW